MYVQFPSALTEEEETLKQTFTRLKKKKKILQTLKAAAQSQEDAAHNKSSNKKTPAPSIDSADKATEKAKKLVQSGAIKLTTVKEKSGFKRSKTLERKKDNEKPAAAMGFQPYMPFAGEEEEEEKQPPSKRIKGLSESFVSAGYNNRSYDRPDHEHKDPPKKGNTVYVHGPGVTEDMLRKSLCRFGTIVNITMEAERSNAFVTFEKMEVADQVIAQVNGSMVNNTQLRVQMARRQPTFESMGDGSSAAQWASMAANNSQKGSTHRDKRNVVTYDTDIF